jgi:histone acetyltransferase (RNA polymerase elongator complex component)
MSEEFDNLSPIQQNEVNRLMDEYPDMTEGEAIIRVIKYRYIPINHGFCPHIPIGVCVYCNQSITGPHLSTCPHYPKSTWRNNIEIK